MLGGVELDGAGLAGHSDGDVIAHALIDALLGAANLGDIGSLFPSGEETPEGVSSLDAPARRVRPRARVGLRARQRRLRPDRRASRGSPTYRDEMARRLADALEVEPARIAVRATTTDRLGFTGRGEGLAAQAVALLSR